MDRISANNKISLTHSPQTRGTARLISDLMNPLFLPPIVLAFTSWMVGLSGYTKILSLTILLLLLPLVIWARYCLGIRSLPELVGGAAAGFLLTIIELPLLNNMW